MIIENTKLRLQRNLMNDCVDFLLVELDFDGRRKSVGKVTYEPHKGKAYTEPSFSLKDADAQQLFQMLWDSGFRPNDGTGNSGHVAALKYHLEDMRTLVFKNKEQ